MKTNTPTMTSERVDAVPLLWHLLTEKMGVDSLLDELHPRHGNWQGLSVGQVVATWLTHIISEGSHVMSHVEAWGEELAHTLAHLWEQPVGRTDLSDDRLAHVLEVLSDDALWRAYEQALSTRMVRVYRLPKKQVRLDTFRDGEHRHGSGAVGVVSTGALEGSSPGFAAVEGDVGGVGSAGGLGRRTGVAREPR